MITLKISMVTTRDFRDTDSLMNEIKTEDVYEDFCNDKEILDFRNYSTNSKYYDNSNKLVVDKMTYETVGVAIAEFVELKPKMYLVDDNNEHKKGESVNRNVFATISYNEYKDVVLNNKCL